MYSSKAVWKSFVAAILLIGWLAPASAAVTISGTCVAPASGISPNVSQQTVAAGLTGGVLVVAVVTSANTTISNVAANWDSSGTNQSMTALVNTTSSTAGVFLFGLRNPTAVTNGNLSVTWLGGGQTIWYACVFQGADVTSDATAFPVASRVTGTPNSAPITITVPSATGNIVFAGSGSAANFTSTTGVIGCPSACNNSGVFWATMSDYWNTTGASTVASASPGSATTSSIAAFEVAQTASAAATPTRTLMGVGP